MESTHRHRPVPTLTRERPFAGPVPFPRRENPAAHGWVTVFERCRCGQVRRINRNGAHAETGRWHFDPYH